MYVKVTDWRGKENTYRKISGLSFNPQIDVSGTSLPINEFDVDIRTEDTITAGQNIQLYDDRNLLWADYLVTSAKRQDDQSICHVIAQSRMHIFDNRKVPATMYDGRVEDIVYYLGTYRGVGSGFHTLALPEGTIEVAASLGKKKIKGFCPEQTVRERLAWICLAIGGVVKDFFSSKIQIVPVDTTVKTVPLRKTFWKPTYSSNEIVSEVMVRGYSYMKRDPAQGDNYFTDDNGDTWVYTTQDFRLANNRWDAGMAENPVEVTDVSIINADNATEIMSRIAMTYFSEDSLEAEIINNREYFPAEKLKIFSDSETNITGFVQNMDFSFGMQSRAKVTLIGAAFEGTAKLIVVYKDTAEDKGKLQKDTYQYPEGYTYTITNPYPEKKTEKFRFVFYPLSAIITGTKKAGKETISQECLIALRMHRRNKVLRIISVDSAEINDDGVVVIS